MPICLTDRLQFFAIFQCMTMTSGRVNRRECPLPPRATPEKTSGEDDRRRRSDEMRAHQKRDTKLNGECRVDRSIKQAVVQPKREIPNSDPKKAALTTRTHPIRDTSFLGKVSKTGAVSAPCPVHPHKMTMEGGGWAKCPRSVVQQMTDEE